MKQLLIPINCSKGDLFNKGKELIADFCVINNIKEPKYVQYTNYNASGYVTQRQPQNIYINVQACKLPVNNPIAINQSYPGNKSDRTVIGVLCHEFGHYVDLNYNKNAAWLLSKQLYQTGIFNAEKSVTSYDKSKGERIAEGMRLFMLNPNLLKAGRPKLYNFFIAHFKPVLNHAWEENFVNSLRPDLYINWCKKWLA